MANDVWFGDHDGVYRERYFYQLCIDGAVPDVWNHIVSDGELDKGMVFTYRWLSVAETQSLIGHMGDYLKLLS